MKMSQRRIYDGSFRLLSLDFGMSFVVSLAKKSHIHGDRPWLSHVSWLSSIIPLEEIKSKSLVFIYEIISIYLWVMSPRKNRYGPNRFFSMPHLFDSRVSAHSIIEVPSKISVQRPLTLFLGQNPTFPPLPAAQTNNPHQPLFELPQSGLQLEWGEQQRLAKHHPTTATKNLQRQNTSE